MKKIYVYICLMVQTISICAMELNTIFKEEKIFSKEFIEGDISGVDNSHDSSMCSLGIDPKGKYFATGEIGKISIWDANSFSIIKEILGNTGEEFYRCIDFSTKNNILAAGLLNDNTIKIYNYKDGNLIRTLVGHTNTVTSIDFSPNSELLASSSDDGSIKLWDVSTGKEKKTFKVSNTYIKSVIFSNDGKYLISGGNDNLIRIWDISAGKEKTIIRGHKDCVYSLDISSNGKFLASGDNEGIVKIWNTEDWSEKVSYKTTSDNDYYYGHRQIESLHFNSDSKFLVSGSQNKNITIFDLNKYEKIFSFYNKYPVWSTKLTKNTDYIISDSRYNLILWRIKDSNYKSKTNKKSYVKNYEDTIIASLPINFVAEINKETNIIFKPLIGNINSDDFEILYFNGNEYSFYAVNNIPIYANPEKNKVLINIEKSKVMNTLYYSRDLNMIYLDDGILKGWLEPQNIGVIKDEYNKVVIINNNTLAYENIDGLVKSMYNSGDILSFTYVEPNKDYYYSEDIGWISKKDVAIISEVDQGKRIFSNLKEVNFNLDLTGNNYKKVPIGTEYRVLGTTDNYYLVESKSTEEKGWVSKKDISFIKPDLNDPVVIITDTEVDENNMLTISGKIYDDTAINSVLLNGNKIVTKPLTYFDKLSYTPEVGYSFTSQWFLIEGMENNVEIKVVDKSGKSYNKVLNYTPELKTVNLNEFQIENIVTKLPKLEYSMELKDENNDGILSGSEKMNLVVKVVNTGEGEAKNVNLKINGVNPNLAYNNNYSLGIIKTNETKTAVIEITGKDDSIALGKASFDLAIEEGNGFNPFPAKFSFNVEPKLNPKLEILDYAIDDENKNGQIEQGEKFDLYVLVQNTGEGESKNTILEINKKIDGVIPMAETSYKFDSLKSGESKKIKFSFVTNYRDKGNGELPFDINLYNEKNTVKDNKSITLTMNKIMPTIKEVNLEAKKKEVIVASKISLISDVDDTSKLVIKASNSKKWAVVIGVENYKKAPDVEFAERDALVTKEYFNKLLGVPNENIFYLSNSNATKTELETLLKVTLKNRISKDDEVYFYFSGHGVPANEGDSYLLLNDSDPANPKISAYPIKELYEDLGTLSTSKSYAFLDTCFSGGVARGDEKESLLGGTRAVMKVNDVALAYNNLTVYTATGKDQLSNSFKEQGHGLFTYFLLKGIGGSADIDGNKKISTEELQKYIKENVSKQSRVLYGESRYQEPMLKSKNSGIVIN